MRSGTAIISSVHQRKPPSGGVEAGSVTASIKYALTPGTGTWDNPQTTVPLNGAAISTPIHVNLNITAQTGAIVYVMWLTKLGAGAYVTRRGVGEDQVPPYNPLSAATNGIPISWWDNSQDGTYTIKATVVFDDATTQDITATFTLTGNVTLPSNLPPPTNLGKDIRDYMTQPAGLIVVPNGTYTAGPGTVTATHAFNGAAARNGWLVLIAETQGGCTINLSAKQLQQWGCSRILFVGFNFRDGMNNHRGCDRIRYWYCTFSFPADVWWAQYISYGGNPVANRTQRSVETAKMTNNNVLPTPFYIQPQTNPTVRNTNIRRYGVDIFECGDDGTNSWDSDGIFMQGERNWRIKENQSGTNRDPGQSFGNSADWFHNDSQQWSASHINMSLLDSWMGQKIQMSAIGKKIENFVINRVWFAGSDTCGIICSSDVQPSNGKFVNCSMDTIRAFCNGQIFNPTHNFFRMDTLGATTMRNAPPYYFAAGTFEFPCTNLDQTIPAGVTVQADGYTMVDQTNAVLRDHVLNPANIWRAANPYGSWDDFLAGTWD